MALSSGHERVRVAELVSALSLGIDLGFGQPMEHVLRQCLIALRLAELLELDEQARAVVYYTALLVNVGCHSDAHEQAKWFGDDIGLKATKYDHDARSLAGVVTMVRRLGTGSPPLHRLRIGLEFAVSGRREIIGIVAEHARISAALAERLELPDGVSESLIATYERWDGRGWPDGRKGDQIPMPSRLVQVAEFVEVAHRVGGTGAAIELAQERSGSQFDPAIAALLCAEAERIFAGLDAADSWEAVVGAEPALAVVVSGERFDAALEALADFADVKSPYFLGHSRAVSELTAEAARTLGLPDDEVLLLRRAGLVHDLGRLGVSNAIWDKRGPLGSGERERVRMHPYLTERMLHASGTLAPLGHVIVQHAERLDGSGYPRALSGAAISRPARILAAANVYQAMREPRAHRPERTADEAAAELRVEAKAGRLDSDATDAVLGAVGHRVQQRRGGPAGLTAREVEVLRLLARGLSNREIAARLVISPKTAGNHIEHIYAKIAASNRATASLFAMQHGLLPGLEVSTSESS
jgi:HD-GYP domain-containing protein (c-di-GMP phosphodiesterase class II)